MVCEKCKFTLLNDSFAVTYAYIYVYALYINVYVFIMDNYDKIEFGGGGGFLLIMEK